jgi:tRNA (guanosine-2'-O-)-methyltransferase
MLTEERMERLRTVASNRIRDVVVLENIHDPHNAAAALRNCDAFGIQTVHVIFETEKMFNPEKLGKLTSASANKWLTIQTWTSTSECFTSLKKEGFYIAATAIDNTAQSFDTFDFPTQKTAYVFGNEGFGITETAKRLADKLLYLPMYGFVDSLNLSVTVGVVAHRVAVRRLESNEGRYSSIEAKALADEWITEDEKRRNRQI